MKKSIWFVLIFSAIFRLEADGIYMFEYLRDGERSCCLSLSGTDICNPQIPCTRNVYQDVMGINNYISRLLGLEKAGSLSYVNILTQAQYYIRHVLSSSITQLSYRFDEHRNVKFFHEQIETAKATEKSSKASAASATPTAAAKKEDIVFQYLVKLGLAREWGSK